jgi:hypothetical protein
MTVTFTNDGTDIGLSFRTLAAINQVQGVLGANPGYFSSMSIIMSNRLDGFDAPPLAPFEIRLGTFTNDFNKQGKFAIYIDPSQSPEEMEETLLHELLHAQQALTGNAEQGKLRNIHYPTFYADLIFLTQQLNIPISPQLKAAYLSSLKAYPKIAKEFGLTESLLDGLCFPAITPILTPFGTTPISTIQTGDTILAFDPSADLGRGGLVAKRVTKLYRNTTTEWIELDFGGAREKLTCTPGHHFLDEFGNFPTIAELLLRGSKDGHYKARLVLEDGTLHEATGKRIVWSEATAQGKLTLRRAANTNFANTGRLAA